MVKLAGSQRNKGEIQKTKKSFKCSNINTYFNEYFLNTLVKKEVKKIQAYLYCCQQYLAFNFANQKLNIKYTQQSKTKD